MSGIVSRSEGSPVGFEPGRREVLGSKGPTVDPVREGKTKESRSLPAEEDGRGPIVDIEGQTLPPVPAELHSHPS